MRKQGGKAGEHKRRRGWTRALWVVEREYPGLGHGGGHLKGLGGKKELFRDGRNKMVLHQQGSFSLRSLMDVWTSETTEGF